MLASALGHVTLTVLLIWLPRWLEPTPEPVEYVSVVIVPPSVLGIEEPPPPPPTRRPPPEPPPPEAQPPPPPPPDPEVPVLQTKPEKQSEPRATPPPPAPAPPPPPPRRQGSPFGSSLGASTSKATVGVEDPNFTYGYYLDRVVRAISDQWVRPGTAEVKEAIFYFRIQANGAVTDIVLRQSSGEADFDAKARRSIEAASPMPPLPRGYQKDFLGINLVFK